MFIYKAFVFVEEKANNYSSSWALSSASGSSAKSSSAFLASRSFFLFPAGLLPMTVALILQNETYVRTQSIRK
jgi:hypothetical protein